MEEQEILDMIGKNIRQKRLYYNLTQEELAERCGYTSKSTINKIELGKNDMPITKLFVFAKVFDCSVNELITYTEQKEVTTMNKEELAKQIGSNIRQKRIRLGLTQEELAKKCGYAYRASITKIELGNVDLPIYQLFMLAKIFNCKPGDFLDNIEFDKNYEEK